jgi:glycosyltransferase involved in cell wall biosynthesis
MNRPKLKILMVSEASFLSSGFANYTRELLTRLHETGKYDIAEFACYGFVNDPRDKNIPWKYYANAVKEEDPRYAEYNSRGDNQFGRWRYEKVLLDFRPDVTINIKDYWMAHFESLSPLRKYVHQIWMPTVDSAPQQEEWVDNFIACDSVFTYSDWGAEVLKTQSNGKINYIDTVSPGVNLDVFKPLSNKNQIKKQLEIPEDSIIVGSVMRNQKRKLFPELMKSFRQALDRLETENYELGSKLYLYLHTSYPDAGWDLPELLKEHRIANKVLFSYLCRKCSRVEASVFAGPQKVCKHCLEKSMTFSSVTNGIADKKLAEVYNVFDLYVQYAICEGMGIPQLEAGACGIPIATVNYSAMVDVIKKLNAISIEPAASFKELETKAIRVYPDNDQLADEIIKFISQPEAEINKQKSIVRKLTEKHYNWDDIAKKWEKYLDFLDQNYRSNWDAPVTYLEHIKGLNELDPRKHFAITQALCEHYLKDKNIISSSAFLNLLQSVDYTFGISGMSIQKYEYQDIIKYINTMIDNHNQSEQARVDNVTFKDDFIEYAKIKHSVH